LKSTFNGLQSCRWQFIQLAVVASKICEIPRNSLKNSNWQQFKVIQGQRFGSFPIGGPLKPSLYLQLFSKYRTLSIFGLRPWPFTVMCRHRSR